MANLEGETDHLRESYYRYVLSFSFNLGFAYGKTETWIKGFFWNREWFTISAWWNQFKEVL